MGFLLNFSYDWCRLSEAILGVFVITGRVGTGAFGASICLREIMVE